MRNKKGSEWERRMGKKKEDEEEEDVFWSVPSMQNLLSFFVHSCNAQWHLVPSTTSTVPFPLPNDMKSTLFPNSRDLACVSPWGSQGVNKNSKHTWCPALCLFLREKTTAVDMPVFQKPRLVSSYMWSTHCLGLVTQLVFWIVSQPLSQWDWSGTQPKFISIDCATMWDAGDAGMQSLIGFRVHTRIGGTDVQTDRQPCWKKLWRFSSRRRQQRGVSKHD